MAEIGNFAKKWISFCWDQLENSSSPLQTILDKPLKKFEKVVSGRDLHGVTSRKRWDDYYFSHFGGSGEEIVKKTPELAQNCQKKPFLPISQRIAVRKRTGLMEVQNISKGRLKNKRNRLQTDAPLKYDYPKSGIL